jgi:hypothetical protein
VSAPRSRRALLAGAVLLAAAPAARAAAPPDGERLDELLGLELRLEAAYEAALERDAIEPGLGRMLLAHEREHVRGLGEALRGIGRRPAAGSAPPPPAAALAGRRAFATYARELEGRTVAAYEDTLATYRNVRLLQPLAAIMGCGAQHEVALRRVLGLNMLTPVASGG